MPLNIIPYQPLYANDRPTDCFGCGSDYCIPFQPGDPVRAQYQQTPCAPSITCDGDFTSIGGGSEVLPDGDFNALGAEEIVNGTFTGNANGWAFGTGWAYNSNNIRKTAGSLGLAIQTLTTTFPDYVMYRVVFTVSNYSGGTLTPLFDSNTFGQSAVSANGTYTQYIKVGAGTTQFHLLADSSFGGDVDTVSVKRIAATWDFGGIDSTGWYLTPNGWAGQITNGLALTCPGVITPNTNYDVTVEFEASAVGFIRFGLGGTNTIFYTISGATTLNFQIQSGAGVDFEAIAGALNFAGEISSISVVEDDDDCWGYDAGLWELTGGAICKTPGTSDILTNTAVISQNVYYQVKITIENRTAGFVQLSINGVPLSILINGAPTTVIQGNGTFIMYNTPTANSILSIFASATFDGCISDVEIFELQDDFLFELRDSETGDLVATISDHGGSAFNFVRYFQDYVTLIFTLDDPLLVTDVNPRVIPYGCYKIYSYDNCEVQYEELVGDGEFLNPENVYWWDQQAAHQATEIIVGGRMEFDLAAPNVIVQNSTIVNNYLGTGAFFTNNVLGIPAGFHNYRLEWDIISSDDTNIKLTVKFGLQRPIADELSTVGHHSITLSFDPEYQVVPRHWLSIVATWPIGTSGTVIVDNVSAHRIEPFDATYISECIKYAESFPCTKYIKAYCDSNQMGFEFEETGFFLGHRIYMRAINPDYPEDQSDYLYSEGTRAKNFFQTQKNFVITTGLLPESSHDAIRVQRGMQHFQIGEPLDTFTEYFAFEGYKPAWQGNGQFELAVVRFEIAIKDTDTKFFRNT